MAAMLLTTKCQVPPLRPNLVPRQHLIDRLNRGLHRKLTLLSAPAGFGKTTLLCEWIQALTAHPEAPVRMGWLSIDEGDNDPARFLTYLVAALQSAGADMDQCELASDRSPGLDATAPSALSEAVLTALINQIGAAPRAVAVVLDDYHLITAQGIHDALGFLIDHLPANMHVVISTRADPPLQLARLRGRGQLTELRLSDLRFMPDEVVKFLHQVMGLELAPADVSALARRTEGWVAGLQMAAVSLQGRGDATRFVQAFTGSDRNILDYLVAEVLEHQSESVQDFLLQTAVLDRLTASLCDSVTGQDGGQATLEWLERANLFVVPLDNERRWCRYHRLFADLLRAQLQRTRPDEIPVLHRRASAWYEANGMPAQAVEHALSAGDYERSADLIEGQAEETWGRGEHVTLLRWLESLPEELLSKRPYLGFFHTWGLLVSGRPWRTVESRLGELDEGTALMLAKAATLRAYVAIFRGQTPRAVELSRQALEQLPEDELLLRSLANWDLGTSYLMSGDMKAGIRVLGEAIKMSQESGNAMVSVMTLCNMAELQMSQGQLEEAREGFQRALELARDGSEDQGRLLPIAGMPLICLGELWRERNDLEAATRYLTEGIELIGRWGEVGAMDGYIALARVKQAQGDPQAANEMLEKARQLAVQFDATDMDDFLVAVRQARLWLAQGNTDAAARWVEEQGLDVEKAAEQAAEGESDVVAHLRSHTQMILARVLIARDRPAEALAILEPPMALAERHGRHRRMIEICNLKALACQAQGDIVRAIEELEQALSLAEPAGYVRTFVDEGKPMAQLLYQAASRGIAPDYAGRLLAAFGEEAGDDKGVAGGAGAPLGAGTTSLVEPLSKRELEVLELIADGLSNQEIGRRLVISLRTVKWHASNVYGKLGVKNRTQAVAKARTLGILPVT